MVRKLNTVLTITMLAICIVAGMGLLCFSSVYADDEAQSADIQIDDMEVPVVTTPEEYAEEVGNVSSENPNDITSIMLMIDIGELGDTYGAAAISYSETTGMYILEFETQEETLSAYDSLEAQYGDENVLLDLPVTSTAESEFDFKYQTYSNVTPAESVSWGADVMKLDEVRDEANNNAENYTHKVTVAILDSGYNPESRLTKGRISSDSCTYVTDSYKDDFNHGSHVAGIVADCTSEQVDLMIIKVLDNKGSGSMTKVFAAATYAMEHGADVVNMSLAVDIDAFNSNTQLMKNTYSKYDKILKQLRDAGVFIVCASGNEYHNADDYGVFPAISENTIAVGAIDTSKRRASFSNYGNCVDYVAPGVGIASSTLTGDKLIERKGTSMATPHVASAYAMAEVLSQSSDNDTIQNYIDSCTVDLGTDGRDIYFGNGYICMSKPIVTLKRRKLIYDSNQKSLDEQPEVKTVVSTDGSTLEEGTDYTVEVLPITGPGKNYVRITYIGAYEAYGSDDVPYNVVYRVTPTITLSKSSYTYTGKSIKPVVAVKYGNTTLKENVDYTVTRPANSKLPGTYTIGIKLKGSYEGTGKKSYTIVPKGTEFKSFKKYSGAFTVKWYKQSNKTTGYQIRYSKKSSMKGAKYINIRKNSVTSRKVKGLKKKCRYYIQIRTYTKIDGKYYYSSWSSKRRVTV